MDIISRVVSAIKRSFVHLEAGDYYSIRSKYKYEIKNSILEYLISEGGSIAIPKNQMKQAMVEAFTNAYDSGYEDGGGSVKEMRTDDNAWLASKQQTELGFIDQLFDRLREMKKEEPDEDNTSEVDDRSESYTATLDGVYAEGKLRGSGNVMLTFGGDDGEESCPTCKKWKGKRHAASFWIIRGLIPGQPGNVNFACRGYNCQHILFDDKGEIWAGH